MTPPRVFYEGIVPLLLLSTILLFLQHTYMLQPCYALDSSDVAADCENKPAFDPRTHFATKTPYDLRPQVHHTHRRVYDLPHEDMQCKMRKVFAVIRHGTRYPTKKHMKRFKQLETFFASIPEETAPDWTQIWKTPFNNLDEGLLAPEGERELFALGQRMRKRFVEVLGEEEIYHPKKVEFRSSQVPRALQSGSAFAHGMYEGRGQLGTSRAQPIAMSSETKHLDKQLRFHKACPAYKDQVKKNETLHDTGDAATLGKLVLPVVAQHIKNRLDESGGGGVDLEIGDERVAVLWNACKFEAAVFGELDRVCSLFPPQDVLQMEQLDDATDYFVKGHGFEINSAMSCPLLSAALDTMRMEDKTRSSDSDSVDPSVDARFWFAHAETVMPLIARLGLYKDHPSLLLDPSRPNDPEDCDADTEFSDVHNRMWRSSALVPFAANIVFVRYDCGSEDVSTPYVQILHNEQTVELDLPDCHVAQATGEEGGNGHPWLCPLDSLLFALGDGHCPFDDICNVP